MVIIDEASVVVMITGVVANGMVVLLIVIVVLMSTTPVVVTMAVVVGFAVNTPLVVVAFFQLEECEFSLASTAVMHNLGISFLTFG